MMDGKRSAGSISAGKKGLRRKNKTAPRRLSFWRNESGDGEGGELVVKGVSKRVIVVKAPDERVFEQAIFIVREDYAGQGGVSEKEVLRQARKAAEEYLHGCGAGTDGFVRRVRAPLYAAAGAVATALAWLAVRVCL